MCKTMWLLFSLITFLAWGTADLFYKQSNPGNEKYTGLKTSAVVGVVMGITAVGTIIFKGIDYNPRNILIYLPVSAMYILSMTVGYFGLRYLELSVSSPVQNASGAVTCIMLMIFLREIPGTLSLIAVALISVGVVLLGIGEKRKNDKISRDDGEYRKGFAAIMIPIAYCVIDSLGTYFDGIYLDDYAKTPLVGVTPDNFEDVANISYELTFLAASVLIFVFLKFKKEKLVPAAQGNRLAAACFETAGQFAYVYALSGNAVVAAPVVASYCIFSAVLARLFLKEKLTVLQYCAIILVISGIIILGIVEGIEG